MKAKMGKCRFCSASVRTDRLHSHQTKRCPSRPKSTTYEPAKDEEYFEDDYFRQEREEEEERQWALRQRKQLQKEIAKQSLYHTKVVDISLPKRLANGCCGGFAGAIFGFVLPIFLFVLAYGIRHVFSFPELHESLVNLRRIDFLQPFPIKLYLCSAVLFFLCGFFIAFLPKKRKYEERNDKAWQNEQELRDVEEFLNPELAEERRRYEQQRWDDIRHHNGNDDDDYGNDDYGSDDEPHFFWDPEAPGGDGRWV